MSDKICSQWEAVVIALGTAKEPLLQKDIEDRLNKQGLFITNNKPGKSKSSILSTNYKNLFCQEKTRGPYTLSKDGWTTFNKLMERQNIKEHFKANNTINSNDITSDVAEGSNRNAENNIIINIGGLNVVECLKENSNIILHGAPGTGKTYLAKEIAKAMCDVDDIKKLEDIGQFKMVQFHPSYDYTDFVEGLRPTGTDNKGNIIFARQDGVFKTFCKTATPPSYESVFSILYDKIKKGDITTYKIQKEYKLRVEDNNIQYEVAQGWRTYNYLKTLYNYYITHDDIDINNINADDINNIIKDNKKIKADTVDYGPHKWAIQELINIAKDLKNNCRSKCIFLIDEINRGDMSKIFGELFYAIDPGYRGEKGKIDTQYQNLIDKQGGDPFKDGFYVPDNVYIIGTMNDIDRSVESMDFAMRRRFQFIEVTAEDRAEGMGLTNEKEAYKRMTNLNNCIISKEIGLSKAYQIGGSYFLKEKIEDGKKISVPITSDDEFKNLWDYRLKGLLREYLRGEEDKVIEEKLENILKPAFNLHDGHSYNTKGEKVKNTESVIPENTTTDE